MNNVVLFQPDIPQNSGNIARTCFITGSRLILVRPCGFLLSDRQFKRGGIDYTTRQTIDMVDSLDELLSGDGVKPLFFSVRGSQLYTEFSYESYTHLIFGSETKGLPEEVHHRYKETMAYLPMVEEGRCLNLANAVAIVLYEGWRQRGFCGMKSRES